MSAAPDEQLVALQREHAEALTRARALEHDLGTRRAQVRRLELAVWRRAPTRRRWEHLKRRLRESDDPVGVLVKAWRVRWSIVRRRLASAPRAR